MSDTPRTDAAYFAKGATMYDLASEMKLLERELNTANDMFKKLNIHALNLADRINRLEEVGNELRAKEARLLNTNGELERRIQRLEEAGDSMFPWSERVGQEFWSKVTEAKL